MESRVAIWAVGWLLFLTLVVGGENGGVAGSDSRRNNCKFPAIFNFGDSNSDTGEASAVRSEVLLPNGVTFGKKFKRLCDGRLLIDFIAENLGLPYLNASLDSIGTSFKHGANFATGGMKIGDMLFPNLAPFHLGLQVSQFFFFKSRTTAMYNQLSNNSPLKNIIPAPEVFSEALYTIDIGQNDIAFGFDNSPVSTILDKYFNSVKRLLEGGAKFLWIHNTGPAGCLPLNVIGFKCQPGLLHCDELGCFKLRNDQAQEFNKLLKDRVYKLRALYPNASITLVDMYSAKLRLITTARTLGFDDPFKYCCGVKNGAFCGAREIDGEEASHERATLLGTACNDPSRFISWDSVHFSEAANRILSNLIVNGSFSDPPLPLAHACHKL